MKILFNHADFFEFRVTKKALKDAESLDGNRSGSAEDALVAFVAVEKQDEGREEAIAQRAVAEIEEVVKQVGAKSIVVYPYAHLSSTLSSPSSAKTVIDSIYQVLLSKGYATLKAPFGWYKAFKIHGKGHPMSELSREILVEELRREASKVGESEALRAEKKLRSKWFVLTPKGDLYPLSQEAGKITGFDFSQYPNLEKFAKYELSKSRVVDKTPPHVHLMRKLELVDYEPASDPGNLRYYPKGRLIKALLEDLVSREVRKYGAMEIEAPIMYDFDHPSLKKYLNRFPARQYTIITPNKKVFLRFAACFGQFLMAHDATISYKSLPLRLYELTKYSFRVEKRGELTGLRRLRSFTMPDCHAFVSDFEMAKREMKLRFELADKVLKMSGIDPKGDLEMGLRIVKEFYDEHRDFVSDLVKKWGKPILVEMWDSRFFYFVMKYEWNFVDYLGKASALTTDQIDVENAITYDIRFTDKDGQEKHPLILHLSPSGAIERVIYALLEKAYMDQESGKKPTLPVWLSPTQVRIIPVGEKNLATAEKTQEELSEAGIRADLDDRDLTMGKKIRDAESEWVPYIVVIGEKEEEEQRLSVRIRKIDKQVSMDLQDLKQTIKKEISGLPYRELPMAPRLSVRPKFVG